MPGGTVFVGGKQLEKSSNKSELLKRISCAVVFSRREKKKKENGGNGWMGPKRLSQAIGQLGL